MNAVVFTNSLWGLPLINELFKQGSLKGIVIPLIDHVDNRQIYDFSEKHKIPCIKIENIQLKNELADWLNTIKPDIAFCMTFPYLIPKIILDIPIQGFVNFHFGRLPENAGADPLFWTLKENRKVAVITAHRMSIFFDCGSVIAEKEVPIIPGENWGLLGNRLSVLTLSLISEIIKKNKELTNETIGINQNNSNKIELKDLRIQWTTQTAIEIESLVNACNPKYNGAITYFRGVQIRILEVSHADLSNVNSFKPGSIVLADQQQGIFVLCSDYKFLRINLVSTAEGYMTGQKLVALGVRTNEIFYSNEFITEEKETLLK
ncbi:formyltransferase family protein [Marivirga salinae]|uniref:Methionyl-tRNA formyltransferase n=1 Tax=Marivirga salinarum TaxID=3059078 RepID=A0AA51RF32_9BACT|nr:formyltransferase family protein [Marivirga sp. BDSF4-3]WMN12615.1 formyltransferase family protein [Marivirga sp. BDSF4-3]